MVSFLKELASIESPSSVPEAQEAAFSLLADALRDLNYDVQRLAGEHCGGHLYACAGGYAKGQPGQLLLGHCDTVWPLGTLQEMPVVVEDGKMRGPGVFDMKGGLTQMIFALRIFHNLGLQPAVPPQIFINSDEELGSHESTPYIRQLAREADRAFVLEPSLGLSGKLKTGRKGVGRYKIVVNGKAAHAGLNPQAGASAILELSYVIQKLFALNDPARGVTVNVGTIDGGLRPNVIAPRSTAHVDVRVPTRKDALHVEQTIYNLKPVTAGVSLEITGNMNRLPLEQTPDNQALWHLARAKGRELGLELEEGFAGGASDGNTTSLLTATLDGLGAVGDGAHASHEFIYLDKMAERSALLALLLLAPPVRKS